METKKSHTDKLAVPFQGVQALKSRIVEALQLDPNEVSVSLFFHKNAQWPCAWNPDLKQPQEMKFTSLILLREVYHSAKICSLIAVWCLD